MVRLTISLADRTHRALKEAAVRENRSMASIIEESLTLRGIQPLDSHPRGCLVTGDRLLLENPPGNVSVISPRSFADTFLPPK